MTSQQYIRWMALNTTCPRFWMPTGYFRNFLDESIPDEVAKFIRSPLHTRNVVEILIAGWQLKNYAVRIGVDAIDKAEERFRNGNRSQAWNGGQSG